MTSSLVGSEMCIRDRRKRDKAPGPDGVTTEVVNLRDPEDLLPLVELYNDCLLYTSDAADDM
eukprot:12308098-Prorocentrum_lima.AAC.1